jgi:predicted CXXCH cytochrome family protein
MRQKVAIVIIIIISMLVFMVVFSMYNRPHAFKDCTSCHLSADPSGARARELTEPVTQLCSRCHEKTLSEGYTHPVDVKPERVAIPADMLLSRGGTIMCSTCHDVHSDYETPYGLPSHFLRRQERGKAFCRICHGSLSELSKGHQASLGEAHFRSRYIVTDSQQAVDPMSINCLSCHDGTYATSVTILAGTWRHEKEFMRYDQGSHPIGIKYEAARLQRGRKTDLRPMFSVDRRIQFFQGTVGCGSCHDPYSALPKKLVMSDVNSELCFACHIV